MSYLVDTNVFSETAKPKPDPHVIAWLRGHESELYVSAITIAEMRRGIELLDDGDRKTRLDRWLQTVCESLQGRVLSFNTSVAHVWGQHKARWDRAGIVVPSLDSQIAATAIRHGLTIVTRNTTDFSRTGVKTLDPSSGLQAGA
ncbi:type II toxin-antitoxin system VapC family toxin [Luteolibacter sp. GHJ8]|uniref:Ribonuclease VapC n=1 Tax=Luteolibacter rhizosphaerae TaxID=2989719 RepID=A0ABT3G3W0_9BACT|nr:type II toxin-antitoxin system VapC family toxin [Luteolibacter rhizosphaerae]MCW1913895.1 type II toxin-antitoxin system VapC family toxin [Luteolibacter rhizosphaerae]